MTIPAQLHRMSTRSHFSMMEATAWWHSNATRTSHLIAIACGPDTDVLCDLRDPFAAFAVNSTVALPAPAGPICEAVSRAFFSSISSAATQAPISASRKQMPRPIPEPAPVTTAIFLSRERSSAACSAILLEAVITVMRTHFPEPSPLPPEYDPHRHRCAPKSRWNATPQRATRTPHVEIGPAQISETPPDPHTDKNPGNPRSQVDP